jgi:hypothetical protein
MLPGVSAGALETLGNSSRGLTKRLDFADTDRPRISR